MNPTLTAHDLPHDHHLFVCAIGVCIMLTTFSPHLDIPLYVYLLCPGLSKEYLGTDCPIPILTLTLLWRGGLPQFWIEQCR